MFQDVIRFAVTGVMCVHVCTCLCYIIFPVVNVVTGKVAACL